MQPGRQISKTSLLLQINAMIVHEMNILQTAYFMCLCKNGNTPSIFKHIDTTKPINKCTTRSKSVFFKPSCKKNFAKFTLSYLGSHLYNIFIASINDLLEAVTTTMFKIRLIEKIIDLLIY